MTWATPPARAFWATMDEKYGTDRPAEGRMSDAEWRRIDEIRQGIVTPAEVDAVAARLDRLLVALDMFRLCRGFGRTPPAWVELALGSGFIRSQGPPAPGYSLRVREIDAGRDRHEEDPEIGEEEIARLIAWAQTFRETE